MPRRPETTFISETQYRTQAVARRGLNLAFPGEIAKEGRDELEHASEFLESGGGVAIPYMHFDKGSIYQMLAKITKYPAIGKRGVLVPIGYHEYPNIVSNLTSFVGIDLMPIVTQSTVDKMGTAAPPLFTGLSEFFTAAGERMQHNGVVAMAVQGRRMSTLGEPQSNSMWTLLQKSRPLKQPDVIPNVLILPVAFRLVNNPSYDNSGFHFRKRMEVIPGKGETVEEILAKIEGETLIKKYVKLEGYVFDRMREIVPDEYK